MADNDMSFCQRAVIDYERGNPCCRNSPEKTFSTTLVHLWFEKQQFLLDVVNMYKYKLVDYVNLIA
jgi:hypothetical protein